MDIWENLLMYFPGKMGEFEFILYPFFVSLFDLPCASCCIRPARRYEEVYFIWSCFPLGAQASFVRMTGIAKDFKECLVQSPQHFEKFATEDSSWYCNETTTALKRFIFYFHMREQRLTRALSTLFAKL